MPGLQIKIVSADGANEALPRDVLDDMIGLCLPVEVEGDYYVVNGDELTHALEASGRTVALEYHAPMTKWSGRKIEQNRCVIIN